MRKKDITLLIAIVMLMICLMSMGAQSQDFYSQINAYRKSVHLKPLIIDEVLEKESSATINKINTRHKCSLVHSRVRYGQMEVLAKNCDNDLQCWLGSKEHKKILLDKRARRIGYVRNNDIACARLTY